MQYNGGHSDNYPSSFLPTPLAGNCLLINNATLKAPRPSVTQ